MFLLSPENELSTFAEYINSPCITHIFADFLAGIRYCGAPQLFCMTDGDTFSRAGFLIFNVSYFNVILLYSDESEC